MEKQKFFDEMYEKYFLNYNLKIKEFKEKFCKKRILEFISGRTEKIFITMLDNNQMYVNKTEMADKFGISEGRSKLNKSIL